MFKLAAGKDFILSKIKSTELACNHTFPIAGKLHLSLSVMFSATY